MGGSSPAPAPCPAPTPCPPCPKTECPSCGPTRLGLKYTTTNNDLLNLITKVQGLIDGGQMLVCPVLKQLWLNARTNFKNQLATSVANNPTAANCDTMKNQMTTAISTGYSQFLQQIQTDYSRTSWTETPNPVTYAIPVKSPGQSDKDYQILVDKIRLEREGYITMPNEISKPPWIQYNIPQNDIMKIADLIRNSLVEIVSIGFGMVCKSGKIDPDMMVNTIQAGLDAFCV